MTNITQSNLIIAPDDVHLMIIDEQRKAYNVASWADWCAPETRKAFYVWAKSHGLYCESVYHGISGGKQIYMLLVYRDRAERAACFRVAYHSMD